jgi:hypothetical protein
MSEDSNGGRARFYSSAADPARARPLGRQEYQAAVVALHATVTPIMERAAERLRRSGFTTVEVESCGAMVSLLAICPHAGVKGTLRFQIHETFAVLVERDPVFWMLTLFDGSDMVMAKPGRLPGLENATPIESIVEDFAVGCELGLKDRRNKVGTYITDVITCALDGRPLRSPESGGELVRFSTCGEKAYLAWAVVPALEAARGCLDRRFPAWQAKVYAPSTGDDSQCGMLVVTRIGKSLLRFTAHKVEGDGPMLFYQVTAGGTVSPLEPLEILTNESGHFVAADAIDAVVGEFIYGLVGAWNLSDDV